MFRIKIRFIFTTTDYTKELIKNNPVGEENGEAAKKRIYEWSLQY